MSESCHASVDGFGFPRERIAEAIRRKGLLSIEIEFSLACNFKCPYCYNPAKMPGETMSPAQIDDAIVQAKGLGAERIIVLGGEPMIYPSIHDRIRFMHGQGLEVEMFTNGSHMSRENAKFMAGHGVAVVLKMNSRSRELQNAMAGRDDAYDIIQSAFRNLIGAGYPAPGKRLAVSTVICGQNVDELPDMWRWLRRKRIEPYFEMITPQGNANNANAWCDLPVARQHELFEEISRIDREEFGRSWSPQPPLVGNCCLRHGFSCLVNSGGYVMPCVGVTIPLGNVRDAPLKKILHESEVMGHLRDYRSHIKGPCSVCENADGCYGCRGAAYQLTGDYLASDPLCWRNTGRKGEIESLPAAAAPYLPHRPPMLLVDTLREVGERSGRLTAGVGSDHPFLDESGKLDETAFVEIIAQAVAALEGFHMGRHERIRHRGVLLGVKNFSVTGRARSGDTLDIHVQKLGRFGDFGVAAGFVFCNGEKIAGGELTFFQNASELEPEVQHVT